MTAFLRAVRHETAAAAVDILRSHSLVSVLQSELERMILDGELHMGERVNEVALASRLKISRGPVREACRSLVQAGLLVTHVNRGFFVRKLALKEVIDLYDVRAALMRLAGQLLAQRITQPALQHIRDLAAAMDEAQRESDFPRFVELNSAFHAALVEATDNRRLMEMYQGLVKEIRLFQRRGLVFGDAMEQSNHEHRDIIDAIATRDGARAAAAMEHHILQGRARFLAAAGEQISE